MSCTVSCAVTQTVIGKVLSSLVQVYAVCACAVLSCVVKMPSKASLQGAQTSYNNLISTTII